MELKVLNWLIALWMVAYQEIKLYICAMYFLEDVYHWRKGV